MLIRAGCTRRVILVGDKAIKISRLGLTRMVRILVRGLRKPARARKIALKRHAHALGSVWHCVLDVLFGGVLANRREYLLYREHPELPLAPVRAMYLWGAVVVMDRGTPVDRTESVAFRNRFRKFGDLRRAIHTCRVNGKLALIDYGHPAARQALGVP